MNPRTFGTSFGEQTIYFYLDKLFNIQHRKKFKIDNKNYECDIYIETLNVGVEFNGMFWHEERLDKDKIKEEKLSKIITMLYVLEDYENKIIDNKIYFDKFHNYNNNLEWAINQILNRLHLYLKINVNKDEKEIKSFYLKSQKENSLLYKHPTIANQWNYEKNKELTPDLFTSASHQKAWWKCELNHEWEATICNQLRNSQRNTNGCPYCNNRKVLKGFNSFADKHKDLLKFWDYENNETNPTEIINGRGKKYKWKCKNNHKWCSTVSNMILSKTCVFCKGTKMYKGETDFASLHKDLLNYWDYDLNDKFPNELSEFSHYNAHWKCEECGYKWEQRLDGRIKSPYYCPKCKKPSK